MKGSLEARQATYGIAQVIYSSIAAGAAGAWAIFGPFVLPVRAVLYKFFLVINNIGNMRAINVEYGPFLQELMNYINSFQISPESTRTPT